MAEPSIRTPAGTAAAETAAAETTPAESAAPEKVHAPLRRPRPTPSALLDQVFFIVAGAACVWLAYLVLNEGFSSGWAQIWFYLVFWLVVAYIALPRLHRILTGIYVPNYFIGRTRTSDGLLGDPVNLGLMGSEAQLHTAMRAAGWTRADDLTLRSGRRIVTSTLLRRSYDEAPVSPLMLFGRNQDFAYQQEVKGNPAKRHHVRFWRCPEGWLLPGGHKTDWLAAGTYDRAVGFSLFTLQITHKIDENTDVERDHIVSTVCAADDAVSVRVLEDFATGYHSRNGGGDAIVTDGDLPIVDLRAVQPTPAAEALVDAPVPTPHPTGDAVALPEKTVRRPAQITFGGAVVLLRAFVPLLIVGAVLLDWDGVKALLVVDLGADETADLDRDLSLWILIGFALAFGVAEFLFGFFVLRGSNVARILVMTFSAVNIVIVLVQHVQGEAITLSTSLVGLSLDILILTALSSSRAREYSRRPREKRARSLRPRSSAR